MSALVLDNEAVGALHDSGHRKHATVLAHLQAVVGRRQRGEVAVVVVPTGVRVEAGWDRSAPTAAAINRFRVSDAPLDTPRADLAAKIVLREGVSVADAHVGACVVAAGWANAVVLSSDPGDMVRVCAPVSIQAVHI